MILSPSKTDTAKNKTSENLSAPIKQINNAKNSNAEQSKDCP